MLQIDGSKLLDQEATSRHAKLHRKTCTESIRQIGEINELADMRHCTDTTDQFGYNSGLQRL